MLVSIDFQTVTAPAPSPQRRFWRVLHDYEIWRRKIVVPSHGQILNATTNGWEWRLGYPEVFWLFDSHTVPFTERWQRLSFDLMRHFAPDINGKKWRIVYDDHRAFMNGKGFWTSGSPYDYVARRDYINNIDLNGENPAWDKIRVCGGATVSGYVDGDMLVVETLDYFNPPTLDWLLQRPWLFFRALVNEQSSGKPVVIDFPQGGGYPVVIPLVAMYPVRFPLAALQSVGEIADPYKIIV